MSLFYCNKKKKKKIALMFFLNFRLYKLSLLRVQSLEHFEIREIMIENRPMGTGRLVYHFMFTDWPDQTAPNTLPLLQVGLISRCTN